MYPFCNVILSLFPSPSPSPSLPTARWSNILSAKLGSYDWSFRDLSSYCVELLEKLQIIIWTYYFHRVENNVIHILYIYRNLNSTPPEKKTQLQNDQKFRNL